MSKSISSLFAVLILSLAACGPPSVEDICAKPFLSAATDCEARLRSDLEDCVNPDDVQECYGDATSLQEMQACSGTCTTMADRVNEELRQARENNH